MFEQLVVASTEGQGGQSWKFAESMSKHTDVFKNSGFEGWPGSVPCLLKPLSGPQPWARKMQFWKRCRSSPTGRTLQRIVGQALKLPVLARGISSRRRSLWRNAQRQRRPPQPTVTLITPSPHLCEAFGQRKNAHTNVSSPLSLKILSSDSRA